MAGGRYEVNTTTIGGANELFASATLAYADTSEHELIADPKQLIYYKNLVVEFKITTSASTTAETLTFGLATSNDQYSGADALGILTSEYWTNKAITLNAGEDTLSYFIRIPANELNCKYLYAKYAYSADPTGDPIVEINYNLI